MHFVSPLVSHSAYSIQYEYEYRSLLMLVDVLLLALCCTNSVQSACRLRIKSNSYPHTRLRRAAGCLATGTRTSTVAGCLAGCEYTSTSNYSWLAGRPAGRLAGTSRSPSRRFFNRGLKRLLTDTARARSTNPTSASNYGQTVLVAIIRTRIGTVIRGFYSTRFIVLCPCMLPATCCCCLSSHDYKLCLFRGD